jgi:hypothetical protein
MKERKSELCLPTEGDKLAKPLIGLPLGQNDGARGDALVEVLLKTSARTLG